MLKVLSQPTSEPITLAEARRWLGMTDDNDTEQDEEILVVIAALRGYAEKYTGRRFCDVELELNLDRWPGHCIELPVAPILEIDYVRYIDTNGVLQTLYDGSASPQIGQDVVQFDLKSQPARLQPAYGEFWPFLRGYDFNSVQIGFVAGYGTGGSPEDLSVIPAELKVWIRRRLATHLEQRENLVLDGRMEEVPRDIADALLDPLLLGRRIA